VPTARQRCPWHSDSVRRHTNAASVTGLAQLYLSLDLPPALCVGGMVPLVPEDTHALHALELGLKDVCRRMLPYTRT